MKPLEYSFKERLAFSDGVSQGASVEEILLANIPGSTRVIHASKANDRSGTDWWVEMNCGDFLSVDAKVREEDYAAKAGQRRGDDLALETWSVVEKKIIGWTRNKDKRTDYVLWLWIDTGRWCLVPFHMLCRVFEENWQAWAALYKITQQHTRETGRNYHSECVFVPRRDVWAAIYNAYSGNLTSDHFDRSTRQLDLFPEAAE